MKLYQDPRAPNPRRVRIFLAEKGLLDRVELVEVSINAGAHQEPAHLERNPLGLVPVLELPDGRRLRESVAICRWFEEEHPDAGPALFGTGAWQRAWIEQWNRNAELELLFPIAQVFRNTHPFWQGKLEQVPGFGEVMRKHTVERMRWLDDELASRPFLAGDAFSIADITAICALDFAKIVQLRVDPAVTPNLERWRLAVSSRPSAKA